MALLQITSPHLRGKNRTGQLMLWVILATVPGLLALTWFFGWGTLIQVTMACLFAIGFEALILAIRKRPLGFYLRDNTALLTGLLLGLALPPLAPWWVTLIAVGFAIIVAKQLYGGLGMNPFNPAMVGYALVLVSFPVQMTTLWAAPVTLPEAPGIGMTLQQIFLGHGLSIDAATMATPLDTYKHQIDVLTREELMSLPTFGGQIARGWEWVNAAFLAGGVFLLWRRIITWHIPVSMLVALSVCSLIFGWDPDRYTPVSVHLLAGATMLGAFFIATDPVSAATSRLGKIYYGAGIGVLVYVIRTWGGYPDAVAFAVLLMNFAAPFLDYYTKPRPYGHRRAHRGISKDGGDPS